eukprot:1078599-Pleurochrysis_carterae.AAC.1
MTKATSLQVYLKPFETREAFAQQIGHSFRFPTWRDVRKRRDQLQTLNKLLDVVQPAVRPRAGGRPGQNRVADSDPRANGVLENSKSDASAMRAAARVSAGFAPKQSLRLCGHCRRIGHKKRNCPEWQSLSVEGQAASAAARKAARRDRMLEKREKLRARL